VVISVCVLLNVHWHVSLTVWFYRSLSSSDYASRSMGLRACVLLSCVELSSLARFLSFFNFGKEASRDRTRTYGKYFVSIRTIFWSTMEPIPFGSEHHLKVVKKIAAFTLLHGLHFDGLFAISTRRRSKACQCFNCCQKL
jgi:hypothetical protein